MDLLNKNNFPRLAKDRYTFLTIYQALDGDKKTRYFDNVKDKLPVITQFPDDFIEIYKSLPADEAKDYLNHMKTKLPAITKDRLNCTKIYSLLPDSDKPGYLAEIKVKLFENIDKNVYHFDGIKYYALPTTSEGNYLTVMGEVLSKLRADENFDFNQIYEILPDDHKNTLKTTEATTSMKNNATHNFPEKNPYSIFFTDSNGKKHDRPDNKSPYSYIHTGIRIPKI